MVFYRGDLNTTLEPALHSASDIIIDGGGPIAFCPNPGSVWIADTALGRCYAGYAESLQKSLIDIQAGELCAIRGPGVCRETPGQSGATTTW